MIGGKWRIDSLLGSGSMAAVVAVTHRNGARAALKILHPMLSADPAVCERFLGEGYLANSVKHPGIVRVLDDGLTDDGCVFLLMDLLEGKTLEALRQERGGRIALADALEVADRLMDVLEAVHDAGIVHRDLKPQNVFVCDDGAVKLLDFGVARVFDHASSKLSMFGLVLGTPSFMPPEQALGARELVDRRSDVWSLAATLFTSITGQTVHLGPNVQARLLAAATVHARSIAMAKPDVPPAVAAAIDTALRFERDERWESVRAFRRALREASTSLEPSDPERSIGEGRGRKARRRRAPGGTMIGIGEPAERLAPAASALSEAPDATCLATTSTTAPPRREPLMSHVGARSSGVFGWLVGLTLAAAAIGGTAFFAVQRVDARGSGSAGGLPSPAGAVAPLTSTPTWGDPSDPPAPRARAGEPTLVDASVSSDSPHKAMMTGPPDRTSSRAPPLPAVRSQPLPRRSAAIPAAVSEPAKAPPEEPLQESPPAHPPPGPSSATAPPEAAPPPALAPDPFSTPD